MFRSLFKFFIIMIRSVRVGDQRRNLRKKNEIEKEMVAEE
jgi:hypothetical protein